jgi:hypothetical protein
LVLEVEPVLVTAAVLVVGGGVTVSVWTLVWEHWMGSTFTVSTAEMVWMLIGTVPMRIWLVTMFWFLDWVACSVSGLVWTMLTRF